MMLKLVYPARSAGQFSDLLIIRVHKIVFFHGGGSGTAYCLTYVGGEGKIVCLLPDLCWGEGEKVCLLPDFRWGEGAVPEAVDCYMSAPAYKLISWWASETFPL